MLAMCTKFSGSRESKRGPQATPKVALAPQEFSTKLSDSLLNNPLWVNNRVRFGRRKQPLPYGVRSKV